jgi:hypothetical protein
MPKVCGCCDVLFFYRFTKRSSFFFLPHGTIVQNKGKGGKNRRRGKNENDDDKRELVFREDGQEYAQVTKMLGNGRLEALCFDGEKRLAHIRGKMRKKVRILSSLWGNQIFKYSFNMPLS